MSEQTQEAVNLKDSQPQREKYWTELTDTEKVERMRLIVKTLIRDQANEIERLRVQLIEMERKFNHHSHYDNELIYTKGIVQPYPQNLIDRRYTGDAKERDLFF